MTKTKEAVKQTAAMKIVRKYTKEGIHPRESVKWEYRDVMIKDDSSGKVVFEQKNIEVPADWSERAVQITINKYFYGKLNTPERETSIHQLVERVTQTFAKQGLKHGYFEDEKQAEAFAHELYWIVIHQRAAWNSPVWFNLGVKDREPQCHACFIMKINDDLPSIMQQCYDEAMIFSLGSGVGTNVGSLRSSFEHIKGGGRASGPVSFMRGYDTFAGVVQSGGRTRRAAIMRTIPDWHPDVYHGPEAVAGKDFVTIKPFNERLAHALVDAGFGGSMNSPAYSTVSMQNANLSVRASDAFMKAVQDDKSWNTRYCKDRANEVANTFPARSMFDEIAKGTWLCGDPGMQFDDTINRWNTCKVDGRINSSNPCSEYLFLDDTACNLASMNLMRYWSRDDGFNIDEFEHDTSMVFIACDISNSFAWLANKKLESGVRDYRTVGVGFCDLGNLVLSNGLAYDSHKARLVMAAVTSLLTAVCYKTSVELAQALGPFPRFEANKSSCIEVMNMHRTAHQRLEKLVGFDNMHNRAESLWNFVCDKGASFGLRNAQATVLAPTGTIAFLMDADTTGPEPVLAHVAQKNLDGGGTIWIVQKSFINGLKTLGYTDSQIADIQGYVKAYHTLENVKLPADCQSLEEYSKNSRDQSWICPPKDRWTDRKCPHLKQEHLSVFDTSFNAMLGTRSIHHSGHIKALAAMQPFLSGGISKTINMPESATVEDIKESYMLAWSLGVKCVAIYRNNCKRIQPLQTVQVVTNQKQHTGPIRHEVPDDQEMAIVHRFKIGNVKGYLHITPDASGKPLEVFLRVGKQGDLASGLMDALAQVVSKALQYGMPLEEVVATFKGLEFSPRGITKQAFCRQAKSLLDYIGHYLEFRFGVSKEDEIAKEKLKVEAIERKMTVNMLVNYVSVMNCPACGTPAKYLGGKCHQCPSCGWTEGGCSG